MGTDASNAAEVARWRLLNAARAMARQLELAAAALDHACYHSDADDCRTALAAFIAASDAHGEAVNAWVAP